MQPYIRWLEQQLFPTVLEAGKTEIKTSADPASGENPLPDSKTDVFSLISHGGKKTGHNTGDSHSCAQHFSCGVVEKSRGSREGTKLGWGIQGRGCLPPNTELFMCKQSIFSVTGAMAC